VEDAAVDASVVGPADVDDLVSIALEVKYSFCFDVFVARSHFTIGLQKFLDELAVVG
jgi:hypothetical protein